MVLVKNGKDKPRAILIGTLISGVPGDAFLNVLNYDRPLVDPAGYTRVDKRFQWIQTTIEKAEKPQTSN